MNFSRNLPRILGMVMVIALLAGCGAPAAAPTATQPLPPLPPPPQKPLPPPQSPLPPPTPAATVGKEDQDGLFQFVRTVQVTPDDQYLTGAFARINFVPATGRFAVTFGGELAQPAGGCPGKVFSYKEYTTEMEYTGKSGIFSCDISDAGSVMVDNAYFFAAMANKQGQIGWHLLKIDAANWKILIDTFFAMDRPKEADGDPMVAYVNGQIDISSGYLPTGNPPDLLSPSAGFGTHHQFFSTDLQFQEKRILSDTPHVHGSYMVYTDGVYHLVTADAYAGDVIVMRYDQDWKYLGSKALIRQAHFSTGLAYDDGRFYLAYTDTSQRTDPGFFPVHLNIRLAAFDREWNLLDDAAVTEFAPEDGRQPGRPWVILHGNHLYVSYDVDTTDPATHEEYLQWQANVSIFELEL
jgi:hypothetical protein